jgi:2-polyprenyl-3-methyl-5-hydroxy-6-metoxy-1,4-benzoquinol methylase
MFWKFSCRRFGLRGSIRGELTTQSKTEVPARGMLDRPCPVCGGSQILPHWQKGDLRLVRCRDCGMVFTCPVPPAMASGEYYDTEGAEYYLSPAKLESDYADVRFERELKLFREFCPRGAVLDVGCGSGAFLFQLKKRWPDDYQVLGTDVSGAPLDYAESRGVPVVRGSFLKMEFGVQKFDAITLWAVAEHLADPKAFLEKAHSLLRTGGTCFVLVPNLKSLAIRLLGAKYRYVYSQHLNYFSETTLERIARRSGLDLVTIRFTHFNPLVIWQDWRGRGREVLNAERGELLKRTTAYKQSAAMKPVKVLYRGTEKLLSALKLADNLVAVLREH